MPGEVPGSRAWQSRDWPSTLGNAQLFLGEAGTRGGGRPWASRLAALRTSPALVISVLLGRVAVFLLGAEISGGNKTSRLYTPQFQPPPPHSGTWKQGCVPAAAVAQLDDPPVSVRKLRESG